VTVTQLFPSTPSSAPAASSDQPASSGKPFVARRLRFLRGWPRFDQRAEPFKRVFAVASCVLWLLRLDRDHALCGNAVIPQLQQPLPCTTAARMRRDIEPEMNGVETLLTFARPPPATAWLDVDFMNPDGNVGPMCSIDE